MKVAQFDCMAGVVEGALLGAWLDAGISESAWRNVLSGLPFTDLNIEVHHGIHEGTHSTRVCVSGHTGPSRVSIHEMMQMVSQSELPAEVLQRALVSLECVAVAESELHGVDETWYEHKEAMEILIHIVGVAAAWYVAGMPVCYVSTVAVGQGLCRTPHGVMPIPTPVVTKLLAGFPTSSSGIERDLVSSVGAAILCSLCTKSLKPASLIVDRVGYGTALRQLGIPDIVRVQLGDAIDGDSANRERLDSSNPFIVEANIDDMNPEWASYVIPRLLAAGASDAYVIPIIMKKGRPGILLRAQCKASALDQVKQEIFLQTSSIGLRYYPIQTEGLTRRFEKIETEYGPITVKIAVRGDAVVNVAPEFEECRCRAEERNIPIKRVYQAATAASEHLYGNG